MALRLWTSAEIPLRQTKPIIELCGQQSSERLQVCSMFNLMYVVACIVCSNDSLHCSCAYHSQNCSIFNINFECLLCTDVFLVLVGLHGSFDHFWLL